MIEINGVAHIALTVSNWKECKLFYEQFLEFLGMTRVFSGQDGMYYVGGRTAVGVGPCGEDYKDHRFVQGTVGLHHICFRARSREDIDEIHRFCEAKTVAIVHPPEEGYWAPGYYSLLIEDPAGIRTRIQSRSRQRSPGRRKCIQSGRLSIAGTPTRIRTGS